MSAPDTISTGPRWPLAAHIRAGRHGGGSGPAGAHVALRRLELVQVAAMRGRAGDVEAALAGTLGVAPPAAGRVAAVGDRFAVWIQPETWLIGGPWRREGALAGQLASALAGKAAVIDQTYGKVTLRLAGAKAREVMAKLCRIDLHPRRWQAGMAAVTQLAEFNAVVIGADDSPRFDLILPATFAQSFLHALEEAAAEFGYELAV